MIYAHLGKMMSGSTQTQFRDVLSKHNNNAGEDGSRSGIGGRAS